MNYFRLAGDLSHQFAILFILFSIVRRKSCAGISAKTQFLFALVFTTRYLDLFTTFISYYNLIAKIAYILTAYVIVWLICCTFRKTYEDQNDSFVAWVLAFPAFILAIFTNHDPYGSYMEIFWTFSIYLEAVAIIPQFYMIHKRKQLSKDMVVYLSAMGIYRFLYGLNWIYRYHHEDYYYDAIADISGVVYCLVYLICAVDLCCSGIKLAENEDDKSKFFGDNIFFITNHTVSINDQLIKNPEKC